MRKILLVEDDPFIMDIYRTKFEKEGMEIDIVKDGEEALRKIKEEPFDLLLLDIVLPKVSGWEVLEKIRENPPKKALKIVVLSNLGQKREVEKALNLGAAKYLIKAHYTPLEVVEEVKKLLL